MIAYYDTIVEQYKKFQELSSPLIKEYTYFKLLGKLVGKSLLDIGFGLSDLISAQLPEPFFRAIALIGNGAFQKMTSMELLSYS